MSQLILALPPGPPNPAASYNWALSESNGRLAGHGSATAGLLPVPGRGTEVLAQVPAALLSWHRVALPRGIGPRAPRLRAVLAGLLEERLLDDPQQLHFALDPDAASGSTVWVGVCRRDWLAAHLDALDAARQPVARIVPELAPHAGAARLLATGEPGQAHLLASGAGVPGGAQALPLTANTVALLRTSLGPAWPAAELQAEPAVAALAESLLDRAPQLLTPAERLLHAAHSRWNLAQFDLARSGRARLAQRINAGWRDVRHAPRWRPLRWGLALLVLVQLAGLNFSAWRTRDELTARRASIENALRQSFPQVRLVVDAPLQMAREVAALRQQAGVPTPRDLEPMLAALGPLLAAGHPVAALEFTPGELRARGVALPATELAQAQERLRPMGLRIEAEDGATGKAAIVLREGAGR